MLQHRITTPEHVHFHFRVAGFVTRAMAWFLDQLILLICILALIWAANVLGTSLGLTFVLLGKFLLDFGYFTYWELYRRGQTPGKKAFGIRVVSSRGGKMAFADVLARTLFRVIDNPGLIPFFGLVGGAVAVVDPLRRRLGDLAADTIVVHDVPVTLPKSLLTQQSRVNTFQADALIRNRIQDRVTRRERDLMFDLILRRDDLDPDVREDLFRGAAYFFRARYNLPEDLDYLTDEQTVLNLGLVIQDTNFTR